MDFTLRSLWSLATSVPVFQSGLPPALCNPRAIAAPHAIPVPLLRAMQSLCHSQHACKTCALRFEARGVVQLVASGVIITPVCFFLDNAKFARHLPN